MSAPADRRFTVLAAVAGRAAGAVVTEAELIGCNVAALITSGHLAEHDAPAPDHQSPPAEGA